MIKRILLLFLLSCILITAQPGKYFGGPNVVANGQNTIDVGGAFLGNEYGAENALINSNRLNAQNDYFNFQDGSVDGAAEGNFNSLGEMLFRQNLLGEFQFNNGYENGFSTGYTRAKLSENAVNALNNAAHQNELLASQLNGQIGGYNPHAIQKEAAGISANTIAARNTAAQNNMYNAANRHNVFENGYANGFNRGYNHGRGMNIANNLIDALNRGLGNLRNWNQMRNLQRRGSNASFNAEALNAPRNSVYARQIFAPQQATLNSVQHLK